jgi:hypothetical protein
MALPLVLLVVLAVALMGAYTSFATFARDLAFTSARTELSFWGRDRYQPEPNTIRRTGRSIDALLQAAPTNPEYLGLQASYAAWQAYWSESRNERAGFNGQAVQSQYKALQSRPAHRHSWSKMVEYASRTTTGEAMLIDARARLQALSVAGVPPPLSSTPTEPQPHPI